jgi:hypothetical protein
MKTLFTSESLMPTDLQTSQENELDRSSTADYLASVDDRVLPRENHVARALQSRDEDQSNALNRLKVAAGHCRDLHSIQRLIAEYIRKELRPVTAVWYYPPGAQIGQTARIECLTASESGLSEQLSAELLSAAETATRSGRHSLRTLPLKSGFSLVALPVNYSSIVESNRGQASTPHPSSAHCLLVMFDNDRKSEHADSVIRSTAVISIGLMIDEWSARREAEKSRFDALSVAAMVDIISHVQCASNCETACQRLADSLQSFLQASSIFIGLCRTEKSEPRLVAVSGDPGFDRFSDTTRFAEAALHESISRASGALWPSVAPLNRHALLSHQQFAEHLDGLHMVSNPLTTEEGCIAGAVIAVFGLRSRIPQSTLPDFSSDLDSDSEFSLSAVESSISRHEEQTTSMVLAGDAERFLRSTAAPLASCLLMIQKLADSRWLEMIRRARKLLTRQRSGTLAMVLAVVTATMFIPMDYKIRCGAETQPVERRYVAAPFTGPLEECLVEPGDLVQADQLLARMDGREIRWELAEVQANLNKATKEKNTHISTHEIGNAAIARHEIQRLQTRTELLRHRDSSLEIRSPIEGIVVSGDHRQAEGVPLQQGQSLFEIAPLDRMIVDVLIPEEDVRHVREGMTVRIWLDAFPEMILESTLIKLRPRAELREQNNVFVAELEVSNPDLELRPGMKGSARVIGERHLLGWILFHKPIAHFLGWLGW